MPDRLVEAVFDQVERVPHRRLARLQRRFADMTTTARLLAAGAAAILVVGIGFFALGRETQPGPGVSPSPPALATDSPRPSLPGSELPAALRHPYIGPLRTVEGVPQNDVSHIRFRFRSFSYHNGLNEYMWSTAGVDGNEIVIRSGAASTGCEEGDEGRYPFSLSPGESILTFVAAPVFIGDYHWALAKGDRIWAILVDLPAGTTVAITIDPEDPATFDALVAETMPIVETFDFK